MEEQEVGDVVRLLGFRSDVAALLSVLDVQLNASYATEATSMALLEGITSIFFISTLSSFHYVKRKKFLKVHFLFNCFSKKHF